MAILRFVDKTLSVFVGNLSTVVPHEEVEEVIYELFLQAGPLKGIKVELGGVRENVKYPKGYGFVQFLHEESVEYASQLLNGISVYGKQIRVSPARQEEQQQPPTSSSRRVPNCIPLLHPPPNSHQMLASSAQNRPSPMHPPSSPLISLPHPHSSQLSGSGTPQLEGSRPHHPCLPSPCGTQPLSPPDVQCIPNTSPIGYIPVAGNRDGAFPWQQDGYPQDGLVNTQMHQSRVYANDHPHWLRSDVRDHLSVFHSSRLEGSQLPQDIHRRDRSRSPHRSNHSRTRSLFEEAPGLPRRAYSYHESRDERNRPGGGPVMMRSRSHDGNQPIISHGNQTHHYRGRR